MMAYEFLKTMNHPQYVSEIIIGKNKPQQKELENRLANYLDDACHSAQPTIHRYNIISVN
jgi:hypothetical protein